MKKEKDVIDLGKVVKKVLNRKMLLLKVWVVTFVLSCIWIFPQPRYYTSELMLAPETESLGGGALAGLASNFGVNLDMPTTDAIYPELYPDLMQSNEFIVGLFGVNVKTLEGDLDTDYYTYRTKHKKKNWLTEPFRQAKIKLVKLISQKKSSGPSSAKAVDPFRLSEYDDILVQSIISDITCNVDKKTSVISIKVKDQDALVCATMADSVSQHLQDAIIKYRTRKSRVDVEYYRQLADSARLEYEKAISAYSRYCDSHSNVLLQVYASERDKLENDMQMKQNAYTLVCTQLETMKGKLQERTPAFTVLKASSVPVKPAGPKRVIFVLGMLILVTIGTCFWIAREEIFKIKHTNE